MDFESKFREALTADDKLMSLRQAAVDLRSNGVEKEKLLVALQEFRSRVTERDEDVILEIMDFLYGWCSSHMRID